MQVKISVVIPAYNREKYIERCVGSIMEQTMPPFEIIAVDDGSTDRTVEVLENIKCEYLKIIRQKHKGAQAARNLGILNANGEYIAFLDSDDEWLPQMLERNIEYILKEKKECALYTNCYRCKNNRKVFWDLPGETGNLYNFLLLRQGPMFQGLFVPKKVLAKIGLLDESVVSYQEWETSIRLAKEVKFIHIKEPLFLYHLHSNETISKDWKKVVRGYAYVVKKHRQDIIRKHGYEGLRVHYKFLVQECKLHKDNLLFFFLLQYFMTDILSKVSKLGDRSWMIKKKKGQY